MKMVLMMTRCYLVITALLLLSVIPTAVTEVVKSMSDCDQFLLDGAPPHVPGVLEDGKILDQNRYKPICQTYMNKRRFVTLYDIKNRIPVFSAIKYRGQHDSRRPQNRWKIEPQLEKADYDKNMLDDKGSINKHQAGKMDYRNNRTFDRGHLLPSAYAFNKTDKISTFTLTNIVPQAATFNQGSWNKMEKCIKCVMDKYCKNNNNNTEGFVVTGALPSSNNTLNNKINIPSMLWSAFCCYSSNMNMWLASAHWGTNVPDESETEYLQTKTLSELHHELSTADSEFKVFPGTRCPLHRTVTRFYPTSKNCYCPSSISPNVTSQPFTTKSGSLMSISSPPASTASTAAITSASTSISSPPAPTSGPIITTSATGSDAATSLPLTGAAYLWHTHISTSDPHKTNP
ncbi:uncharacterized protein LOC113168210 [Anabas testudineus]|uniref:uncharacterized protein LOC113168210 n=1 Tax=Anabas testudineus TaxID=64144 RepID=UPI000E45D6E5|nr:uncharacterized protein LOC113168210 [Anabas testudineus]